MRMSNPIEVNSSKSTDDSWIICDSKSHPGLKYYVNKLTGIKVWNITDSEIAFAEKTGKSDPEPPGRPTMNRSKDSRIYNKQIINNQFSNQLSNMLVNSVPGCSPFNVWDNTQNQPAHMPAQQLYTLVPTSMAPLINQIEAAGMHQVYQQLLPRPNNLQSASVPSHNAHQYAQNPPTPKRMSKTPRFKRIRWSNSHDRYDQNRSSQNKFSHMNESSDLRRKLVRKRRSSESFVENARDDYKKNETSTWHEQNNWDEQETSIQMNLAPLKSLTASSSDLDQWYIVVDTDVILKNYNYLNNMAAADPDCHLLIPHHVMSELRAHVSESSNVQARRILRFLTEQIESGLAVLGEEATGENITLKTITTCDKLASQNNNVVLISSGHEAFNYNLNTKKFHVFTMQDIKDILANRSTRPSRAKSPTLDIKIVVSNNTTENSLTQVESTETTTQRNFGSTSSVLANNNVRVKSSLGMYSTNNSKVDSQSPPRSVTNEQELSNSVRSAIDVHSVDNLTTAGVRTRSSLGVYSVSNSKAGNQNTLKSAVKGKVNDSIRSKNALGVHSEDNLKTYDQNSPKSVVKDGKELTDTRVRTRSSLIHSVNISQDGNQNPPKSATICKELPDSVQSALGVHSVDNPTTDNQHHPKSVVKGAKELTNTRVRTRSSLKVRSEDNSNTENQNHLETTDDSSQQSSSPFSNVSLDTINVKRIISKKNLINSQKGLKEHAKMTSIKRQTSTESTPQNIQPTNPVPRSAGCANEYASEDIIKINVSENKEETSTSRLISNSESSYSGKEMSPIKHDLKKVALRRVVMFEVTYPSMQDVLKTRCDEWVFRFVQIMEEVLRVKLQEKQLFEHKEPAPWNLQEAARCIIKKFSNNFNVVDAANKLSFILYKTSDEHGKIAVNIEPSDYMEMYSYGVFLVETFKDMCANCIERDCKMKKNTGPTNDEVDSCSCYEVNTASESLKKLLFDIQNTNLESFADNPCDLSAENPNYSDHYDYETDTAEGIIPKVSEQHDQQDEIHCDEQNYNLNNFRCQKRLSQETQDDEVPTKITITDKGTKSKFLKNLQLQKTFYLNKPDVHKDAKDLKNADKQNALKNKVLCLIKPVNALTQDNPRGIVPQSIVVRNFTVNADLERKVKAKQHEKEYEDYEKENEDNEKEYEDYEENEKSYEDFEKNGEDETVDVMPTANTMNGNENLKRFIARLTRRLGDVFTQVKLLCDEYCNAGPKNKRTNDSRVMELKVEKACSIIENISDCLASISKREIQDGGNIQMLLKLAKMDDFIPDDELCLEYRLVITKCGEKAEEIHKYVRNILKLVRE